MLKDKFKQIAQDEKIIDKNDYWLIENNPMTKIGVFPYLGRQISPDLEPDTIYQVLRPEEELTRPETLKSLELIPLVDEHTMLGDKAGYQPAEEKGIHGVTGTNVKSDGDIITNDLKIYSETLKNEIQSGKKDLSLGYYCEYDLTPGEYNGEHYDAIQRDIIANHIALVDEGRMGKDVRVMDSKITFDTLSDILQQKETDKMAEENKPALDEDKRKEIDEIGGMLKDKVDEELWRTIIGKIEKIAYNPSESGANDEDLEEVEEETEDEDDKPCGQDEEDEPKEDKPAEDEDDKEDCEKEKPISMDEAIKYIAKRDAIVKKVRPYIGDNAKYSSMNIDEVVKYACDKLDIKNSLDSLEGYLKAKSQVAQKIATDSMFSSSESSVLKQYKNQK